MLAYLPLSGPLIPQAGWHDSPKVTCRSTLPVR